MQKRSKPKIWRNGLDRLILFIARPKGRQERDNQPPLRGWKILMVGPVPTGRDTACPVGTGHTNLRNRIFRTVLTIYDRSSNPQLGLAVVTCFHVDDTDSCAVGFGAPLGDSRLEIRVNETGLNC